MENVIAPYRMEQKTVLQCLLYSLFDSGLSSFRDISNISFITAVQMPLFFT